MPFTARPRNLESRRSIQSGWERARLGIVVPLALVVVIAIGCIIVAGVTSANRADEMALKRERALLHRAFITRGDFAVRQLQGIVARWATPPEEQPIGSDQAPSRFLIAENMLVIARSPDNMLVADAGLSQQPQWRAAAVPELAPLVAHLQGHQPDRPAGFYLLRETSNEPHVFTMPLPVLTTIESRPALVAVVPAGFSGAALTGTPTPLAISVIFLDSRVTTEISQRLQLNGVRILGNGDVSSDEQMLSLEADGTVAARFAWRPSRPGSDILAEIGPFIVITIAGFVFLAGLVLRYMRQTAAAIAAGEGRMRHLAMHDPLCGLPNRNLFGERLEATLSSVIAGGPTAALFYIDLDHFKDVNDTLGHPVGDELIRSVTARLSRTLRGDAVVARLGGDEFALITEADADHAALIRMAERITATLRAPYTINGYTLVIGASIGIALIDGKATDSADIMRYADMALYRAKNEGRNRACIYDADMEADLSHRKSLEQDLRQALVTGGISVAFQPIMSASGDRLAGVEALARWTHPHRGSISPGDFIPIAENAGLISDLGAQVLRQACRAAVDWNLITVSVNVSPLQFRQHDFVDTVEQVLLETGISARRLELELTESTLIGNFEAAEDAMHRLKALGVQLALDDFGTGYSSLQYLRRLPFDRIKIDRSFVLSIEKAPDAAAIVHAIVSLGRGLGMKVTAEGVETAEQHLFLRAAGVQNMQGFRFGRPCDAAEITRRIANPGIYRSIEGDAVAALTG